MASRVETTICKVCELLDSDTSNKRCFWCEGCKAFICEADWGNLIRRAKAMKIFWLGKVDCSTCKEKLADLKKRLGLQ